MNEPTNKPTKEPAKEATKETPKDLIKKLLNDLPDRSLNEQIMKLLPIDLAVAPGVFAWLVPGILEEKAISCSGGTGWMVFPGSLSVSCFPEHCLMRGWSIT